MEGIVVIKQVRKERLARDDVSLVPRVKTFLRNKDYIDHIFLIISLLTRMARGLMPIELQTEMNLS